MFCEHQGFSIQRCFTQEVGETFIGKFNQTEKINKKWVQINVT